MPQTIFNFNCFKAIILLAFVCDRELLVNDKNNRFTLIKQLSGLISTLTINSGGICHLHFKEL